MMARRAAVFLMVAGLAGAPAASAKKAPPPPPAPVAAERGLAGIVTAGLAPYLSHALDEPGWVLTGEPEIVDLGNNVLSIRLPDLAYRHPMPVNGPFVAALGPVAVKATLAGKSWQLSFAPLTRLAVQDAAGILGEFTFGDGRLEGNWDPARGALDRFNFSLTEIRGRLRNGDTLNIGQAGLRGQTFGAAVTERADFTGSIGRFAAETAQGRPIGHADAATLTVKAEGLDAPVARAQVTWSHVRPAEQGNGITSEITPAIFELSGRLAPLPWVEALRNLPPVLAGLFTAPDEMRKPMAEDLWNQTRPVLHAVDAKVSDLVINARSAALFAFGRGEAAFPKDAGQAGKLVVDVRGINERIASLSSDDRRRDPMLFPYLALMTVLAEKINENGKRHHRYELELVNNGLRLNGKDISTIQPPK